MFSSLTSAIALSVLSFQLTSSVVSAASFSNLHSHNARHDCQHSKRLPSATWYHERDHPAHKLFRRGDDGSFPEVGSATWSAAYPESTPDPNALPQPWVDALNAAVSAGKIPDIQPAKDTGGNPEYAQGVDPMSDEVCSTTWKCRKNPDNVYDVPEGIFAVSFDDGPLPPANKLYDHFQAVNEHATHFFIGVNILQNPKEFLRAFNDLQDDIAVHTWTHPHMTTLTNLEVVAQLGWTMEIIHNSTGGRLPKYWRPPFGDSDNRVNAIAKEIFGLKTIIWNQDTEDWSLTTQGTTLDKINASMTEWLTGPKNPGLMILEHELSDQSVQAFLDAWPVIKSNGWQTVSLARIDGGSAYQNADGDSGDVKGPNSGVLAFVEGAQPSAPQASPPASSPATPAPSTSSVKVSSSAKPTTSASSSATRASATPASAEANKSSAIAMSSWSLSTILASFAAFGALAYL